MGISNNKNKNQSTDEKKNETQAQTVENQQTENPAQADSGDTQPPVTPPADSGAGDGNCGSTPTDTPPAGEKDGSEEQPEGGGSQPTVTQSVESDADTGNGDGAPTDTPAAGGADDKDSKIKDKKVKMTLRHKSHTQHYYRCGLRLTKSFAEYDVPAASVVRIKADRWIEVKDGK